MGVAVLVLVLTFGSLLAAGMNLLTAFIGIGVGMGGLLLASNVFTLSSSAPTLALMIGLAVGIDYALFILSRHRTPARGGHGPGGVGRPGDRDRRFRRRLRRPHRGHRAVAACRSSASRSSTVMGFGAAGTVLVAVAGRPHPAAGPARLRRVAPGPEARLPRREARAADAAETTGAGGSMGARWTRLVTRRPLLTVLAVLAGLIVLAIPAPQLRARAARTTPAPPPTPRSARPTT